MLTNLETFRTAFAVNEPLLIMGLPGVGKTRALEAFLEEQNVSFVTLIASIREPSDFGGQPLIDPNTGDFRLAPPAWAKKLKEAGDRGQRTAVFMDEITTCAPSVQAALLRVITDRVVGELSLPDNCWMIAAANPPEIAANGYELTPPLANRFIHEEYKFDPSDWVLEFPRYFGKVPKVFGVDEVTWAQARSSIAGFLYTRPNLVIDFPKEATKQSKAWPSPRTWDKASRCLAGNNNNLEKAVSSIAGAVGSGAAMEYISFMRTSDLPNPEELLKDPTKLVLKERRGDIVFAVLSSVHAVVANKLTQERWAAGWKVLHRAFTLGYQDIATCWARHFADRSMIVKGFNINIPEIKPFLDILKEANVVLK